MHKQQAVSAKQNSMRLPDHQDNMPGPGLSRPRRLFVVVLPLVLLTWFLMSHFSFNKSYLASPSIVEYQPDHIVAPTSQPGQFSEGNKSTVVPLEAHIMSKCPDARDCLKDLIVPAMEEIADMVDFSLSFIGK